MVSPFDLGHGFPGKTTIRKYGVDSGLLLARSAGNGCGESMKCLSLSRINLVAQPLTHIKFNPFLESLKKISAIAIKRGTDRRADSLPALQSEINPAFPSNLCQAARMSPVPDAQFNESNFQPRPFDATSKYRCVK
jgi:hypothetical protein